MKTAISITNYLFDTADALAELMGVSLSRLYAMAIAKYVAKHRGMDVTSRLNQVYGEEPSGIEPSPRSAQARSVSTARW